MPIKFYSELSQKQVEQVRQMFSASAQPNYLYTYEVAFYDAETMLPISSEEASVLSRKHFYFQDKGVIRTLHLPIDLAQIVEYNGTARFISVWWEMGGDELAWSDGAATFVGASYVAFLDVARKYGLWSFEIGDSDTEAVHRLLQDRHTGLTYLVENEFSQMFLSGQWVDGGLPTADELPDAYKAELRKLLNLNPTESIQAAIDARRKKMI